MVSTVSVPFLAGLIERLPFLLVTLQSPKLALPELEDEESEPQAAIVNVIARAAASPRDRLKCMGKGLFPRGARGAEDPHMPCRLV